jgi:hypothetical protein
LECGENGCFRPGIPDIFMVVSADAARFVS